MNIFDLIRSMTMGFQKVRVNSDWSDPANAWQDIKLATGLQEPPDQGSQGEGVLQISLWEGIGDPDDYANLMVVGDNAPVYKVFGSEYESVAFQSPPSAGTAYIIGICYRHTVVY